MAFWKVKIVQLYYLCARCKVENIVMNRIPVVTKNLLAINIIMFLATLVAEKNGIDLDGILISTSGVT